jgi:hypothetical protein
MPTRPLGVTQNVCRKTGLVEATSLNVWLIALEHIRALGNRAFRGGALLGLRASMGFARET